MSNLRDFYLRAESDPAFRNDQLEVYNELEATLQQIKMTLFTKRGEVLGEPEFGMDVEKYLFEFSVDPFALTKDAGYQINKYVTGSRKRDITVKPATYNDANVNREIFVLLIDVPELTNELAIFYD
jgi:hypothetical protein